MFEGTSWAETLEILKRGLDTASLRQRVIANNISNVNTPGFKRQSVLFEQELKEALRDKKRFPTQTTHPKHIEFTITNLKKVSPKVITESTTFYRNDSNNVDIDVEMAALAKNQILYNAIIERVRGKFDMLRRIIRGGGGV